MPKQATSVKSATEQKLIKRLNEIGLLKDGWLDGEGRSRDSNALDWLKKSFLSYYPDEAPTPHLYPTPEGGIQAEWSINGWEVSTEINLETKTGTWHAYNVSSKEEQESILNLNSKGGWEQMVSSLLRLQNNPTK